ncbi:hypothetical protein [Mesonia aestuariivivens]|uniref:Outer membrane protein beta-barrel domain-containing protein n=1 Tax=Mesonia aestuariivivens TaxID=2796128 RepID=A0ABS6W4Y7_9FLAO|nr:hypothetical protein [Mesonia aestuariivivens]MBW2962582.1 hypothetical protein [Mesonia aestuariivivens]
MRSIVIFFLTLFGGFSASAQHALDFGLGASVNVGLQNEWAVQLKSQYHFNEKWSLFADYNLFFRRDVNTQNTEKYHEIALGGSYHVIHYQSIKIYTGLAYVFNDFPIQENNPDTSSLYKNSGTVNHLAKIQLLGTLPLGEKVLLFSEINLKSAGRRYDTFSFGLIYRLNS